MHCSPTLLSCRDRSCIHSTIFTEEKLEPQTGVKPSPETCTVSLQPSLESLLQLGALESPASVCSIKAQNNNNKPQKTNKNQKPKRKLFKYNVRKLALGGNKRKMEAGVCWEMVTFHLWMTYNTLRRNSREKEAVTHLWQLPT